MFKLRSSCSCEENSTADPWGVLPYHPTRVAFSALSRLFARDRYFILHIEEAGDTTRSYVGQLRVSL